MATNIMVFAGEGGSKLTYHPVQTTVYSFSTAFLEPSTASLEYTTAPLEPSRQLLSRAIYTAPIDLSTAFI